MHTSPGRTTRRQPSMNRVRRWRSACARRHGRVRLIPREFAVSLRRAGGQFARPRRHSTGTTRFPKQGLFQSRGRAFRALQCTHAPSRRIRRRHLSRTSQRLRRGGSRNTWWRWSSCFPLGGCRRTARIRLLVLLSLTAAYHSNAQSLSAQIMVLDSFCVCGL